MQKQWIQRSVAAGAAAILATGTVGAADAGSGSAFRGPRGMATYDADLPTSWSEADNKNVRWKVSPGLPGWSSPVVAADKVVVTGGDMETRKVWCYATADGKEAWSKVLPAVEGASEDFTTDTMDEAWDARMYAAATPATDAKLVFVLFSNGQLAALKLADGALVWNKGIGYPGQNTFGLSNSLRLYNGKLLVVFEGEDQTVAAYDMATGDKAWSRSRPSATWSSPILIKTAAGKNLLVLLGNPDLTAWDADTGARAWSLDILSAEPEYCVGPSPVFDGKLVFANSENAGIYAVDPDNAAKAAWAVEELPTGAGFPDGVSMVTHGKYVYQFFDCYLSCLDAATGKVVKEKEMEELASYASPFVNRNHIYLMTQLDTIVVDADPDKDFAVVGTGALDDFTESSPAVAGNAIYIRSDESLYCIGK